MDHKKSAVTMNLWQVQVISYLILYIKHILVIQSVFVILESLLRNEVHL